MPKEGKCCICGIYGPLSFEHVPPRSAFNNKPVIKARFDDVVGLGPDEIIKGKGQQQGAGDYTLCPRCNNNTGSWYGKNFVDWCYQGYEILSRTHGRPSLIYLNYLFPLRIVKQIFTMFFSINGPGFADANPELVKFVLNRDYRYLSPKYRLFVYFSTGRLARSSGVTGLVDLNTQRTCIFSEMNYFPYGYVLALNSHPPDPRLIEISHFARYGYNELARIGLRLPVLPTHLYFPGDYRTKEQILADRLKAEKTMNPEELSKK
jgi:hypothetical protein